MSIVTCTAKVEIPVTEHWIYYNDGMGKKRQLISTHYADTPLSAYESARVSVLRLRDACDQWLKDNPA